MIGPSTCGAMPMKLANTSASSVRGNSLVRVITNAPVITAAATIAILTILPRRRRCGFVSLSGIASPSGLTEEQKPKGECKKSSQAGIDQDERRQQLIFKVDVHEKQANGNGEQDADNSADDPCGKIRSQDIERGSAGTSGGQQRTGEGRSDHGYPKQSPAPW